ncbi:amine oxidase [Aaosphaeria arxii CBS 175.79]|uniref:Amine oxidase n=1 Tax=Aaosphaeria arxii CBS 175.79 TaxID=1450172 RepID=A0A6A5XPS3_9PLEO|nr:amine oxidase [Aaosphaeria arxii CBS 175.79]KAF2014943.1 amine oxidase [Aaosphaeria arxii CBS 175.79]
MTRIQRDLSGSPHQANYLEPNGEVPMIRRAIGRVPHVCIVGAGAAGLRCADVLLQQGVKVTILEGRNRIGGRLCQSSSLGHMVDLGPNWIHGTDDNPFLDLAKKTKTEIMTWDGRQAVFDQYGAETPLKEATENSELVWTIIEQGMRYSNENTADIPVEKSLYDFFEEKVKELIPSVLENDQVAEKKRDTILKMSEMWGAFIGTAVQKQSLKFFWLEECIDGENLFVAGTYHKILNVIAQNALQNAEIQFEKKVASIDSHGTEEEPAVSVRLDNGEKLNFDEVVMTAPLGWLKKHKDDAFSPDLPSRLKQGIDSIGYGHLDKVYMTFPSAFWNESNSDTTLTPPPPPTLSPNVPATTAPLNQPTPPTVNPNHYPGFAQWISPYYAPETNPSHWSQECVNLAALPPATAHPTLLFYTYGPTSLHIASVLSSTPESTHDKFLQDFFTPYYSRLPNYSPSDPSCKPAAILATAWANDELAGNGSYANFQTGLERGDEDVEVMRRGLPERGLWLAGEHTAPFVALGTVTGAYWAGEGVGKRILKAYGLDGKST